MVVVSSFKRQPADKHVTVTGYHLKRFFYHHPPNLGESQTKSFALQLYELLLTIENSINSDVGQL